MLFHARRARRRLAILLLAVGGLLGLFYRPELDPVELETRYADESSRFLEIDGVRVHYRDEGDGPPLLLIHGTASSLHTWDGWVDELGEMRLIRLDLPGFGLTGPDSAGDYSPARRVEILGGLLDRLGVERCSVAGNSLGGFLALKLAIAQPDRVDRLVLLDPAGYPRRRRGGPTVFDLGRTPVLKHFMSRLTPRFMVALGVRQSYGDLQKVTPELIDRYYDLLRRRGNREALVSGLNFEGGLDLDAVRALPHSTLILWGSEDRLISVELADEFDADIPESRLLVYDGIGHLPMEEIPVRSARDAREFLRTPVGGGDGVR